MEMEKEKLLESKSILMKLANGINPLNNEPINDHSFLHDPQIIRPLFYLSDYISKQLEVKKIPPRKPATFHITDEQLKQVTLPLGKIGINDFSKAINVVIDPTISKKITGTMINKKLKAIGILSEEVDGNGHRVKVKNDK